MKRSFSLRLWLMGGIVVMVVAAYVGVFVLAALSEILAPALASNMPEPPSPQALEELYTFVESQSARWDDPAWQAEVQDRLDRMSLGLRIDRYDGSRPFMYPAPSPVASGGRSVWGDRLHEVVFYQGDQRIAKIVFVDVRRVRALSEPPPRWNQFVDGIMPFAVVVVVSATIWGAITIASRSLLGPLRQLAAAASQINRGDLTFTVPSSRIKELNEFARAFDHMREGLRESIERQAALEQERRLFVSAMAHDLRTPLTSVRGYLEGIRDGMARTPEKLDRYVSVALEKTAALERLVDGLFTYAKTEYLHQGPQREPLDLGTLLEEAVAGVRPQAGARGVALAVEPSGGGEPCLIQGDAAMLLRVVDNLLDNAIRHTPAGGTVTVGWQAAPGQAHFWVQDTGPGIPPADLERIFAPAYRADQARSTRTGGAGLGLAIARRLVEAHGGTIIARNRDGAQFVVTLPLE